MLAVFCLKRCSGSLLLRKAVSMESPCTPRCHRRRRRLFVHRHPRVPFHRRPLQCARLGGAWRKPPARGQTSSGFEGLRSAMTRLHACCVSNTPPAGQLVRLPSTPSLRPLSAQLSSACAASLPSHPPQLFLATTRWTLSCNGARPPPTQCRWWRWWTCSRRY